MARRNTFATRLALWLDKCLLRKIPERSIIRFMKLDILFTLTGPRRDHKSFSECECLVDDAMYKRESGWEYPECRLRANSFWMAIEHIISDHRTSYKYSDPNLGGSSQLWSHDHCHRLKLRRRSKNLRRPCLFWFFWQRVWIQLGRGHDI